MNGAVWTFIYIYIRGDLHCMSEARERGEAMVTINSCSDVIG